MRRRCRSASSTPAAVQRDCAPAAGSPRSAARPTPVNLRRAPRAAPDDRPDARSALHTAPHAPLPALQPRTLTPLRSPSDTTHHVPNPATAATTTPRSRLPFDPCPWHSCSWRPPPLTQPDLLIGRRTPPLKSQQPSGHRPVLNRRSECLARVKLRRVRIHADRLESREQHDAAQQSDRAADDDRLHRAQV